MGSEKSFEDQLKILHQWPNAFQLFAAYEAGNVSERAKLCEIIDEVFDTPRALDFAYQLHHVGTEPSRRLLNREAQKRLREALERHFEMAEY